MANHKPFVMKRPLNAYVSFTVYSTIILQHVLYNTVLIYNIIHNTVQDLFSAIVSLLAVKIHSTCQRNPLALFKNNFHLICFFKKIIDMLRNKKMY